MPICSAVRHCERGFDMRNGLVIALVLFLGHPIGAQDAKDSVVGLWLGEARTQGGLGNWIDFHGDGTVEFGFGALVGALLDDTYRLEDSTLTLHLFSGKVAPDGVPVFESLQKTVQIEGEHAVVATQWKDDEPAPEINSPDEQAAYDRMRQPLEMTRVGPATAGASAIAGTWSYQHYTGQTAYETFTPGGKWYLRVQMDLRHGRYTVTPAGVTVQLPERSDTFRREGDVLMLSTADGKHSSYRRAPK